jgi:hypothetical protein
MSWRLQTLGPRAPPRRRLPNPARPEWIILCEATLASTSNTVGDLNKARTTPLNGDNRWQLFFTATLATASYDDSVAAVFQRWTDRFLRAPCCLPPSGECHCISDSELLHPCQHVNR